MPYKHTWELRGIVRRFWGHVTAAEIAESADIIQSDSRFDTLSYILNNFSDCASVDMQRAKPMEIAAKDGAAALANSQIRIAVVSDRPDVLRITDAYMAESFSAYVAQNFDSMEAARSWLSIPQQTILDTQNLDDLEAR